MREIPDKYKNNLPGTILKDIATVLQFMADKKLDITGNKGLLPNNCMLFLNTNMSHPLKLELKRQQQMSYPHINALYMLCRTLDLIHVTQNKSKRYLEIHEKMLTRWEQLNTTEKYFNLMQTWFFRCDERLINRDKSQNFRGIFNSVLDFFQENLKKTITFKNEYEQQPLNYWIKTYNLALLEMFGMVEVEDSKTTTSKSWAITKISATDFGKKILSLLKSRDDIYYDRVYYNEEYAEKFYQKLRPIFPAWNTCLKPNVKITDVGVHYLKISLTDKIWRRISIQGSEYLCHLAQYILDAFDFDDDHLYEFKFTNRHGAIQTIHDYESETLPCADDIKLGDIDILTGDPIEFIYDFGDYWKFTIQIEKIEPPVKKHRATLIKSMGKAPEQYPDYEFDEY